MILCWINYLTDFHFDSHLFISSSINNHCDAVNVDYGVLEGRTLGPLLFLIYINNIDKWNINGHFYLFVDGTAVLFDGLRCAWEGLSLSNNY